MELPCYFINDLWPLISMSYLKIKYSREIFIFEFLPLDQYFIFHLHVLFFYFNLLSSYSSRFCTGHYDSSFPHIHAELKQFCPDKENLAGITSVLLFEIILIVLCQAILNLVGNAVIYHKGINKSWWLPNLPTDPRGYFCQWPSDTIFHPYYLARLSMATTSIFTQPCCGFPPFLILIPKLRREKNNIHKPNVLETWWSKWALWRFCLVRVQLLRLG